MSEHFNKYYSSGKLLITSEYLILKGAKALAIPVKYGQTLRAKVTKENSDYKFSTFINGDQWLSCILNPQQFDIVFSNNKDKCSLLLNLIIEANKLNPGKFEKGEGLEVISEINFNIKWGLGSSSSLISNIAYLYDVDPYLLHTKVSSGSGYDVICARSESPILYRLENLQPLVEKVNFYPVFHDQIAFVYTGQKMDSSISVNKFLTVDTDFKIEIVDVSGISDELLNVNSLYSFNKLIFEHEKIMSSILKEKSVKENYFSDFYGEIKSLGAWGGDFLMVSSGNGLDYIRNYFEKKNMDIVIPFSKMIL